MKKRILDPNVSIEDARQMIKVMAVLLRDDCLLSFEEVVLQLSYSWRFTESIERAVERDKPRGLTDAS